MDDLCTTFFSGLGAWVLQKKKKKNIHPEECWCLKPILVSRAATSKKHLNINKYLRDEKAKHYTPRDRNVPYQRSNSTTDFGEGNIADYATREVNPCSSPMGRQ